MSKKYYWIKLKTDFFDEPTIDFLLSQKNGCEYIVLYQMICLKTANSNGVLKTNIGEMMVPYDVNKIVRDTKYFDFDTVTVALELYKKLGLIYENGDGILSISKFAEMIGSESSSAQRVRKYRERKALQCNENVTDSNVTKAEDKPLHCNIDIRDKSIDIRDKIIDKDNKEKNIYGEFNNVLLTDEEYEKLKDRNLLYLIENLSSYMASKNKKYKSHYATILTWARKNKPNEDKGGFAF